MSSLLKTRSLFYYGYSITSDNFQLDFNEGGGELTAQLNIGNYTLTEFVDELIRALNSTPTIANTYDVVVDRDTRIITISADGNFDLLVQTGSHAGTSAFSLAGFTGLDRTGAATYDGNIASGSEFRPQFFLQGYVDPTIFKKNVSASVNESANGEVEVVTFGEVSFTEFDIRFNTDTAQPNGCLGGGSYIETSATGVPDLIAFMDNITKKNKIEFMKDRDDTSSFFKLILERTREDSAGIGYKLRERTDIGLSGYFDTGIIRFRVVNT